MNNHKLNHIDLRLKNEVEPKDVLFFTGAGISVAPPSNFPLGNVLHRMILEHAEKFNKSAAIALSEKLVFEETISRLAKLYNSQSIDSNIFLHILSDIFIFSKLENHKRISHQPNDYHKFFNWHIMNKGNHFTVNIDQFIEPDLDRLHIYTKQSFKESNYCTQNNLYQGYLLKIHGDINIDEWGKQGYLCENIQQFDDGFARLIDNEIHKVKFVIFVGYGGVDKFDITPYFNSKQNGFFKDTNALWIKYGKTEELQVPNEIYTSIDIILSKFNKHIVVETSNPELILNNLFKDAPVITNTTKEECRNGKEVEEYLKTSFSNSKSPIPPPDN